MRVTAWYDAGCGQLFASRSATTPEEFIRAVLDLQDHMMDRSAWSFGGHEPHVHNIEWHFYAEGNH